MGAIRNFARMTSSTTGTGTLTLGSAISGFLTFGNASVQNSEVVSYSIRDGVNSEMGIGTYTASGTTLSRDTVYNSTNAGSKISCSGNQEVFITPSNLDIVPAVTAFPTSYPTNGRVFRTDRRLEYFYDGTRWLTTTLYEHLLGIFNNLSLSSSAHTPVWEQDYDVYMYDMYGCLYAVSGLSGSAYWSIEFHTWDGLTQSAILATLSNVSEANATFVRKKVAINALMGTAVDAIDVSLTKVSTPGNFYGSAFLTYRLVG